MVRWKESGLSGNFFAVNCRSVQMGSYKFCPFGHVLISSEGLVLEAQVFDPQEQVSNIWTNVTIPFKEFSKVEACFRHRRTVIFINANRKVTRDVSIQLGLPNSPYDWDSQSLKEKEKRLTLLSFGLDNFANNAIRDVFNPVFRVINVREANRLLSLSTSPADCLPETSVDQQQATSIASCSTKEPSKVEVSNNF